MKVFGINLEDFFIAIIRMFTLKLFRQLIINFINPLTR